jgi:predicted DNA-binding WGR domain protein
MPRYELSGGFFWTIELADSTITTSVGALGKNGHTRIKRYGSAAEAKRAHDTLVAEKLEQGYALVGAKPARPAKAKATPAKAKRAKPKR